MLGWNQAIFPVCFCTALQPWDLQSHTTLKSRLNPFHVLRCRGEGTTPEFGRPGGIPSPGRDTLPKQCSAELHSPSLLYHVLGCSARTALHPRLAQAAAMQVLAEYSTDTCFVWSVSFVSFWGQGHACNTLMSGATVQWSTGLECPGHSWHTINMHRICQVNWVLRRRLSVLSTLCMPSFSTPLSCSHSGFWETPATGVFTDVPYDCIALSSSPAHFAVTLHCTPCHKTSCHPSSSLQCTRISQLQPFTSSLYQPQ